MEVQSARGRLYASAAKGWMVGEWKSDSWSVVLLDKYREKQRHGGRATKMKIKGHSATTTPVPCAAGRREKTEIRFRRMLRELNSPVGEKTDRTK